MLIQFHFMLQLGVQARIDVVGPISDQACSALVAEFAKADLAPGYNKDSGCLTRQAIDVELQLRSCQLNESVKVTEHSLRYVYSCFVAG